MKASHITSQSRWEEKAKKSFDQRREKRIVAVSVVLLKNSYEKKRGKKRGNVLQFYTPPPFLSLVRSLAFSDNFLACVYCLLEVTASTTAERRVLQTRERVHCCSVHVCAMSNSQLPRWRFSLVSLSLSLSLSLHLKSEKSMNFAVVITS